MLRPHPIRVTVVDPSLAGYRVPFYRRLAAVDDIDLHVLYGDTGRPNAQPDGFRADYVPRPRYNVGGHPVYWHPAQLQAARSDSHVVVLNWDVHYASLVPALVAARARGVRTILWGHGVNRNDGTIRAWPRRAVGRLADVLLAYTRQAARRLAESGFDSDRVFAAPNSLDQTAIQHARANRLLRPDELHGFKLDHDLHPGPVVLFVSRLDRPRRVDVLIQATRILRERFAQVRTIIVGGGPAESSLRDLVDQLDLNDHVRFVGPVYDETALSAWYCSADAFVFPSFMGLSVLHAMGYRLPVVIGDDISAHGPEAEAVRDRENGLLFRHNDPTDLARKLELLLCDHALRERLAANALRTAMYGYSIDAMLDGFVAAIRRAAS